MRKIAADAGTLDDGVVGGGGGVGGASEVIGVAVDPFGDGDHFIVGVVDFAEFVPGEAAELVGLAVAGGEEVGDEGGVHFADGDGAEMFSGDEVVVDFDGGLVGDFEVFGFAGLEADEAVFAGVCGEFFDFYPGFDGEVFIENNLGGGAEGVDVEDECAGLGDGVGEGGGDGEAHGDPIKEGCDGLELAKGGPEGMTNDEGRMTNQILMTNEGMTNALAPGGSQVFLQPPAEGPGEAVDGSLGPVDLFAAGEGDSFGVGDFEAADGLHDGGEFVGADDGEEFEVDVEGARVEVAGADDGVEVVDDHGFGVEHLPASFVDAKAAADEFVIEVGGGALDDGDVGLAGDDDADADASAACARSARRTEPVGMK